MSDGRQLLVDATWRDNGGLRDAHETDARRIEQPSETMRDYGTTVVHCPADPSTSSDRR